MIRICLLLLLCVVSLRASAEISADTMNNTDVSGAYVLRAPSGSPKLYLRDVPNTSISITASPYSASVTAADNAAAIQSAINAAIAAGVPLRIPSVGTSCFKYTPPLTINGNLTIIGDGAMGNWPGNTAEINIPTGNPPLVGSVLCPAANGQDAIDITGDGTTVNITNLGILWQTTLGQSSTTTGDGIHYIPGSNIQGLSGSVWQNVMFYGHDGNHYAVNLSNFIYDTFISVHAYGGGGFNLTADSPGKNYGNSQFDHAYTQVIVGGSAYGFNLTANRQKALSLLTFLDPQSLVDNISGITPAGNPPTAAQLIWSEDANVWTIKKVAPDMASSIDIAGVIQMGAAGSHHDWDWNSFLTNASVVQAPSWGANGLLYGPVAFDVTDTTSTGTVANEALFTIPSYHQKASSATTYTHLSTLYLGVPVCSTNCTATAAESLYSQGPAFFASTITGNGNVFLNASGAINDIAQNAGSATVNIGNGSTTGTVLIGGNSNTLNLNAATLQSRGITAVSCAANTVNLTTFVVTNGIVTHC